MNCFLFRKTCANPRCLGGSCCLNISLFLFCFFQLKSLFKIFTFVIERNIKYQYLILPSLILVACIEIVLVFLVQYIKDRSINSIRILRVISWLFLTLVYLFTSDIYFRFDPRVGRYEKSKMLWGFSGFLLLYMEIYYQRR